MHIFHVCGGYYAKFYSFLFESLTRHLSFQDVYFPMRDEKEKSLNHSNNSSVKIYRSLIHKPVYKILYFRKGKAFFKDVHRSYEGSLMKVDCFHGHTLFNDGSVAYKLSVKYNKPLIVSIRSADMVYYKYFFHARNYAEKILKHSSKIICISPQLKYEIIKRYPILEDCQEKIEVIPNGIPNCFLSSGSEVKKSGSGRIVKLLYVGSFIRRKRIIELIKSIKSINLEGNLMIQLTVVGGGGKNHKKVVKMLKEDGNCTYIGFVKEPHKLIDIYRSSDIFILPSVGETFGIVYIEALSQGLPVIFTKYTGIDGLFRENAVGVGIKKANAKEINSAVQLILKNYESMSATGLKEGRNYSWDKVAERFAKVYYASLKN